ncbi:MAG: type II toxin-antitoxin system RelB/DinJ family antitoxin [Magnetococcales bacterium]|nr:type II toxin-antitoxin system RelB/DinJ family antitoxin [Magnetococcales bacterium]
MIADSIVRARIDTVTKEKATAVLTAMGLNVSDAIRLLMRRIAEVEALPFEVRVPNALTLATLQKSQRGEEMHHARDEVDLFEQLGIGCAPPVIQGRSNAT